MNDILFLKNCEVILYNLISDYAWTCKKIKLTLLFNNLKICRCSVHSWSDCLEDTLAVHEGHGYYCCFNPAEDGSSNHLLVLTKKDTVAGTKGWLFQNECLPR